MLALLSTEAQSALVKLIDERVAQQLGSTTTTTPEPETPWLTVAEAAAYLRTSKGAIRKRIERGQLPSYRPEGSPILLRREDLDGTGRRFPEVVR